MDLKSSAIIMMLIAVFLCAPISSIVMLQEDVNELETSQETNAIPVEEAKASREKISNELTTPMNAEDVPLPFGGFIKNLGQLRDSSIVFYYTSSRGSIAFSNSQISITITSSEGSKSKFSIYFDNSNNVTPLGIDKKQHVVNYIIGNLQKTNVPTYDEIWYYGLYDGIDLRYFMSDKGLKYEFIVHAGADPTQIALKVSNELNLVIKDDSVSIYSSHNPGLSIFQDTNLLVFQDDGSYVSCKYTTKFDKSNCYGFEVGDYNLEQELVIDPYYIWYSTYFGGFDDDTALAVTVDDDGNCYVVGWTNSTDFPTLNQCQSNQPDVDVFVVKLDSDGYLVYSTYVGGNKTDSAHGVAVDSSGNAYVCGYTQSNETFPLYNAYNDTFGGGSADAFVFKLNNTGNGLVFNTYIGGKEYERCEDIAIDSDGKVYVTGYTRSEDFPTKNYFDNTYGGGTHDVFVTKFNSEGSDIEYSTFLGGSGSEVGYGIAIYDDGYCYVAGTTTSSDFPTYLPEYGSNAGSYDAFVTKLNPSGSTLNYSTYLGGSQIDQAKDLVVDPYGYAYVVGLTLSNDFPIINAYDDTLGGANDAFVTIFEDEGQYITRSTYVGGVHGDSAYAAALGPAPDYNLFVAGSTAPSFPLVDPIDSDANNGPEAFAFEMDFSSGGCTLEFSTFLGGAGGIETSFGIAVDSNESIYVIGVTESTNFPILNATQENYAGERDVFITKLEEDSEPPVITLVDPPDDSTIAPGASIDLEITDNWILDTVEYAWDDGENHTLTAPFDIKAPSALSERILHVYANDSLRNSIHQTFTFEYSNLCSPYNTLLSGSDDDVGYSIALDSDGNVYVVGKTMSSDFHTLDAMNETHNGGMYDIFISKLDENGSLVYSSFLGGSGDDIAYDVVIDDSDCLCITGETSSPDFPTTSNAINDTLVGECDAFVLRLNLTDNTLLYCSYFGGSDCDVATNIKVSSAGYGIIVGRTNSSDFPVNSSSVQTTYQSGGADAFVASISLSSQDLAFSTFLGGSGMDEARTVDISSIGDLWITGWTSSTDFPLHNEMQTNQDEDDIFISCLNSDATTLKWSTYLGGNGSDYSYDTFFLIAFDWVFIIGSTTSDDYPQEMSHQPYAGGSDAFITLIDESGGSPYILGLSTYIGGSGDDVARSITLYQKTSIYMTLVGSTDSTDFPIEGVYNSTLTGGVDGFVVKMKEEADFPIVESYYVGGSNYDSFLAATGPIDDHPHYVTGFTNSSDYPLHNAFQDTFNGGNEVVVAKFAYDEKSPDISLISPVESTELMSGVPILLNVTDSCRGVSHVLVNWDAGNNQTLTFPYQIPTPSGDGSHTLYVYSNDTAWNWDYETFDFTIDDTLPEIILDWPGNETLQKAGILGDIDFVELHLDTVLFRWDSGAYFPVDAPYYFTIPFGDGMHTLHVIANDTAGNWDDSKYVFYNDDIFPEISLRYPVNNTAHHSNLIVEADIYDLRLEHVLYRWDSAVSNSTWSEPYETFLPSGDGVHHLHVYANDTVENWEYVIFTFITDDTLPGLSHPSDKIMDEGELGQSITWIPTSPDPFNYTIYNESIIVKTGDFVSESPISISLDGLPYGEYNFTILIMDGSYNLAKDWVFVTVIDSTFPVINEPPDIIYEDGSIGNTIIWNGTDVNPVSYHVLHNGSLYASGLWNESSEFITININGLEIGPHHFAMVLEDIDDNSVVDVVIVVVVDQTAPIIEEQDDFAYVVDTTGHELVWIATDRNPVLYEVYRNGSLLGSFDWDGDPISVIIDGLTLGIYNYTIRVLDIGDNQATHTIWVSVVVDEIPPIIDDPPDIYYQVGTPGHNLTWTPEDEFPDHFEIYRNGTPIIVDDWEPDDENITISIDGLEPGLYNFTIIVYDDGGNNVTNTIWVEVVDDTTIPTIDHPNDVEYNEETTGHEISWTPVDDYPSGYRIFRNGIMIESGDWTGESIVITIDGLAVGVYNYTIECWDVGLNNITDTVMVNVLDVTLPSIDMPSDISYAEGSTGNSIEWTPTDLHPASYKIFRNGTELESDHWTGDSILISIDGLGLGSFNYTIIVSDESGNTIIDTVMVFVYDGTPPIIDSPPDIEYVEGDTGNSIIWSPSDAHPVFYEVLLDGIVIHSEDWTGNTITVSVDGLSVGTYNYTLKIEDIGGNTESDTVMVLVTASSTTPTSTVTTTTITTTPPDNTVVIIIVVAGVGGAIVVVIIIFLVKKGRLHLGRGSGS